MPVMNPPYPYGLQSTPFAGDGTTPLGAGLAAMSGQSPFMGAGPSGIQGLNLFQDMLMREHPDWGSNLRFEGNDAGKFRITGPSDYQSAIEASLGRLQSNPIFGGFMAGMGGGKPGYLQGAMSPLGPSSVDAAGRVTPPAPPQGGSILDYGLGQMGFTPAQGSHWFDDPFGAGDGPMGGGYFAGNFGDAVRYLYGHNLTDPGFRLPSIWTPPPAPSSPMEAALPMDAGGGGPQPQQPISSPPPVMTLQPSPAPFFPSPGEAPGEGGDAPLGGDPGGSDPGSDSTMTDHPDAGMGGDPSSPW